MSVATRRFVYLSGTRADFGLMRSTLQRIAAAPGLSLSIAATGTHLSAAHGHTVDEITAAGLQVCERIHVDVSTRSARSMSDAVAQVALGMSALLQRERPDALMLLGDRGEMLAGAIAALHLGVPAVHIHGGERSGTVDEPVRHAISKLASLHLVATAQSRERLLRMGEDDWRIHVTGAPGLDGLLDLAAGPRDQALAELGMPAGRDFVLAVFHPVVQQAAEAAAQTGELLQALGDLGLPVLWLEPNADAGSRDILAALEQARLPAGSRRVTHLPRDRFTRAMRHAALMVGNSSSGIIEAASFGTPVVNVGDRQKLRERNANVVDAATSRADIARAAGQALGMRRGDGHNVYGDGCSGERIASLLATVPLSASLLEKSNAY